MRVEAELDDALESELGGGLVERAAQVVADLLPVARTHRHVLEVSNERHRAPELVDAHEALLQDVPALVLYMHP